MIAPTFTPLSPALLTSIGADVDVFDPARAVYTNRDLDLAGIKLVGFDMDYTLAIYNKAPMEQLQYDLTVDRLVQNGGYPREIKELRYDPSFVIRGLVVDKRTGNILKMDTHGRVARAFHGLRRLTTDEVQAQYAHAKLRLGSESLASADTLFSMPGAALRQPDRVLREAPRRRERRGAAHVACRRAARSPRRPHQHLEALRRRARRHRQHPP